MDAAGRATSRGRPSGRARVTPVTLCHRALDRGAHRAPCRARGHRRGDSSCLLELPLPSSRADERRRTPSRDAGNRDAYRPASSRCSRGRASPAPRAGRPRTAARARRTSAAACADGRGRQGPAARAQRAEPLPHDPPGGRARRARRRRAPARRAREVRADGEPVSRARCALARRPGTMRVFAALAGDGDLAIADDRSGVARFVHPDQLGEPQARRIAELEHRAVADLERARTRVRSSSCRRLVRRERLRQRLAATSARAGPRTGSSRARGAAPASGRSRATTRASARSLRPASPRARSCGHRAAQVMRREMRRRDPARGREQLAETERVSMRVVDAR